MQPLVFLSVLGQGNDSAGQKISAHLLQGKFLSAQIEHLITSKSLNNRWLALRVLDDNLFNADLEEAIHLLNVALQHCTDSMIIERCLLILKRLRQGSNINLSDKTIGLGDLLQVTKAIQYFWCGTLPWQIRRKLRRSNSLKFNLDDLASNNHLPTAIRSIALNLRTEIF